MPAIEDFSKIKTEFPRLFDKNFEFEVNVGWYNIIHSCCFTVNSILKENRNNMARFLYLKRKLNQCINRGDNTSFKEHYEKLKKMNVDGLVTEVKVVQVKEKFGTLRFYTSDVDATMFGAIRMAENMSAVTCEMCGNPGNRISHKGWLKTRCDECNDSSTGEA